ncbi:MAG: hypothetical protein WAL16_01650, partial [Streptosporangiaceae bacterium]
TETVECRPAGGRLLDAAQWDHAGTGPLGTARLLRLTASHMRELNAGILAAAQQETDVLLLQGISSIGGYHIADGLGLPSMGLGLQPIYPTREFPPSTVTARSFGALGNRAAGQALVALGSPVLAGPVKELRAELGLPRLGTCQAVFGQQAAARWPAFHGFSPAVVPRPADWRDGLEVTGYWWPPRPRDWHPTADLEQFLADGPPPVFAGFGSMDSADPARLSEIVGTAGQQAGVRLVIQAGRAGLTLGRHARGDSILISECLTTGCSRSWQPSFTMLARAPRRRGCAPGSPPSACPRSVTSHSGQRGWPRSAQHRRPSRTSG